MKFLTISKSTLVLLALFSAIALFTLANSSEIKSTIKTNNLSKAKSQSKSNSLLKSKSKYNKKYSFSAPPGTDPATNPEVSTEKLNKDQQKTANKIAGNSKKLDVPQDQQVTMLAPAPKKTGNATKGQGDIIFNDWLMVGSKGFKNHYHEIQMGFHGDNIRIKTDSDDFRINDAFSKDTNKANQPIGDKYFWFRLTKDLIFYSNTKQDLNLLGGIRIKDIIEANGDKKAPGQEFCFDIEDKDGHKWEVCSEIETVRNEWFCKIQELRNEQKPEYCNNLNGDDNTKVIVKNVIQPYIIIPVPSRHCNEEWNYQQHGDDWECDCSEGKEQSPIDLPPKEKAIDSSAVPLFKFSKVKPSSVKTGNDGSKKETENLKIKLEENNLRIKHDKFGKTVTPDGSVYFADEIVIHTPAEHTINGKKFDMEIQIIHRGKSVGDIGKQLILSFVFEKTAGVYNKFIDDLDFFNLPNPLSKSVDIVNTLFVPKILHSSDEKEEVNKMKNFSFYTYQGSLTAPPCTEETIMYVNSKPIPIGTTALHMFQEALRVPDMIDDKGNVTISDWIPISNRNIQPINGRPVFHYDHEKYCGPDKQKTGERVGHFEKIKSVMEKYFYVSGKKVSGIPNAFVVSKDEAYGIPKDK